MLRVFDIILSFSGLLLGFPFLLILFISGLLDTGSPIFRQTRIGKYQKKFVILKFRTMKTSTLSLPSHLVNSSSVTKFGHFIRRTKLDELPQLWNVLVGEMSLVGPRPGLINQQELIDVREQYGVFEVLPGITGLSQLSKIDMSTPKLLAKTDFKMIRSLTPKTYFKYIFMTVLGIQKNSSNSTSINFD